MSAQGALNKEEQAKWFRPIWTDLTGASTRHHPAPYPLELAYRLIRMFSFTSDTVLDPFAGTGTTALAAIKADRNSIINEIDPDYFSMAETRIKAEAAEGILGRPAPIIEIAGPPIDAPAKTVTRKSRPSHAR